MSRNCIVGIDRLCPAQNVVTDGGAYVGRVCSMQGDEKHTCGCMVTTPQNPAGLASTEQRTVFTPSDLCGELGMAYDKRNRCCFV